MKTKWLLLIWITVFLGIYTRTVAQEQSDYAFVFLVRGDRISDGQIGILNPAIITDTIEYINLPIENEWRVPNFIRLSPNGNWVAFSTGLDSDDSRTNRFTRLFNFVSGEVRDLEPGYTGDMEWSPDGSTLALSRRLEGSQTFDVFVYSIATESLLNITNDGLIRIAIAWSPDSTKLALSTNSCFDSENCVSQLEVLNMLDGTRQISIALSSFFPIGDQGCRLVWSPNSRYVAFIIGCNPSADVAEEIFLWDTSTSQLEQLTNFTTPAFEPGGNRLSAGGYELLWYDDNTLLISPFYPTAESQNVTEQTYAFTLDTRTLTLLFDRYVDAWVINSITQQIAINRSIPVDVYGNPIVESDDVDSGTVVFTLDSAQLESDQAVNLQYRLPNGCNFMWSPDGAMLAYLRSDYGCPHSFNGAGQLVLVDAATGNYQEMTLTRPDGTDPASVIPLGWVAR